MSLRLPKAERLKSKKSIEGLFRTGRSYSSPPIRFIYSVENEAEYPAVKVTFSVPKKIFKRAVDRNLLKRRMRESYRISKNMLEDLAIKRRLRLEGIIIYQASEKLSFQKIKASTNVILNRIKQILEQSGDR